MESRILRQGNIVGKSPALKRTLELVEKAASVDIPVLILGQTGTGKDLVAEEIHNRSARRAKPFVALNTGVLSRDLVASELFGHVKGAFTGAASAHAGRFLEADGGTLFLDEISSADKSLQIALLRALETKMIRALGADKDRSVNTRIIAASNESLDEAVERGGFRMDLLHRLQVFRIDIPSLSDRREDIPLLVDYFLKFIQKDYELDVRGVTREVMDRLLAYSWPGNIRELKNALIHAAVCQSSGTIELDHLPKRFHDSVITLNGQQARVSYGDQLLGSGRTNGHAPHGNGHRGVYLPWGMKVNDVVERYLVETANVAPLNPTAPGRESARRDSPPDCVRRGVFLPRDMRMEEAVEAYMRATLNLMKRNKTKAAHSLGLATETLGTILRSWESPAAST